MIRHSFAPFELDAVQFLMDRLGIDYSRTNFAGPDWLCVTARRDGKVVGACMFEFKTWFDAYFSIAIDDRRAVSRRVMQAMFEAVFSQAVRVTTEQPPHLGPHLQVLAKRMGFVVEGYKRLAVEGRWDALQLGMTKDTCRFLRRAPRGSQSPHSEDNDGHLPESA